MALTELNYFEGGGSGKGAYYYIAITNNNQTQYTIWDSVTGTYDSFAHTSLGTKIDDDNVKIEHTAYHSFTVTFKRTGYVQQKNTVTPVEYSSGDSVTVSTSEWTVPPVNIYFE